MILMNARFTVASFVFHNLCIKMLYSKQEYQIEENWHKMGETRIIGLNLSTKDDWNKYLEWEVPNLFEFEHMLPKTSKYH